MLISEDYPKLVCWVALFILDLSLHHSNGIGCLNIDGRGLFGMIVIEYLHVPVNCLLYILICHLHLTLNLFLDVANHILKFFFETFSIIVLGGFISVEGSTQLIKRLLL